METTKVTIFSDMNGFFENLINSQLTGNISGVISMFTPLMLSAFTIYVVFIFWSYWGGSLESTMQDIIKRIVAWGLILTFSLNLGTYSSVVSPIVLGLGDGMTQAYNGGAGNDFANKLDTPLNTIFETFKAKLKEVNEDTSNEEIAQQTGTTVEEIEKTEEERGLFSSISDSISNLATDMTDNIVKKVMLVLAFVFAYIPFLIFAVVAFAYIMIAKVLLVILATIGPIFIALALFPATRQFVSSWVNQVVTQGLTIFLMNVLVGVFVDFILTTAMTSFLTVEAFNFLNAALFAGIVLIFIVVLFKIPQLASGLGGGITSDGFSKVARMAMNAKSLGALGGKGSEAKGGSIRKG